MTMLNVMRLMQRGLSLTQACDLLVVEGHGVDPEQWAEARDVTPRAVTKNVETAMAEIETMNAIEAQLKGGFDDEVPSPALGAIDYAAVDAVEKLTQ